MFQGGVLNTLKKKTGSMNEEEPSGSREEGCSISLFDYSVENHLKAMESISDLCNEAGIDIEKTDLNRLSSSVTLLRSVKESVMCIHSYNVDLSLALYKYR